MKNKCNWFLCHTTTVYKTGVKRKAPSASDKESASGTSYSPRLKMGRGYDGLTLVSVTEGLFTPCTKKKKKHRQ